MISLKRNIFYRFKRLLNSFIHPFSQHGFGIHSPVAFYFIQHVINEKGIYYAYEELISDRFATHYALKSSFFIQSEVKNDCLLFRLVNEFQPNIVWQVGTQTGISNSYFCAAKKDLRVYSLDDSDEESVFIDERNRLLPIQTKVIYKELHFLKIMKSVEKIDFVHFNTYQPEPHILEEVIRKVGASTVFVIEGISTSSVMKRWWKLISQDERVYTSYDLYDVGLLLFEEKRYKKHYNVNF